MSVTLWAMHYAPPLAALEPHAVVLRSPRTTDQQDAARSFWSKFSSSTEATK